jgi:hypothetical protein
MPAPHYRSRPLLRHPDKLLWTSLGLAAGYTATDDEQNAVANWETVIQNVPESFKGRPPPFQKPLKKFKTGT